MATLEQIEQALRAADAAGNTEDARRLAQAYAQMRQQQPEKTLAERYAAAGIDPNEYSPTDGMSGLDKFMAGMGKSFVDTGRGIAQLGASALDAIDPRAPSLSGLITGEDPSRAARWEQRIAESRRLDAPLMDTGAGLAGNIVGQTAQIAAPIPGAAAAKLTSVAGRAAPYIGAGSRAAVFGGAQGVTEGESRVGNAAMSGALGIGGQGIANAAGGLARGAIARLSPTDRALVQSADDAGIQLGMGQVSQNPLVRTIASQMDRLPFSGATKRNAQNQEAFNEAVSSTFGAPSKQITADVFAKAQAQLGDAFEELTARNNLQLSRDVVGRMREVLDEAERLGGPDTAAKVRGWVSELIEKVDDAGTVPGRAYQSFDSRLGKVLKTGGEPAHYLGQLRDVVRGAMDESISAGDRSAWQAIRQQWANLKTIEPLVAKSTTGDISPAALMGRVTSDKAGKARMARGGGGALGELAKIGQRYMKDAPNSGTADRLLVNAGVLGGLYGSSQAGVIDPATATKIGALLLANRAGSALMRARGPVMGDSKTLTGLARLLKPAPYLLPAGASAMEVPVSGGRVATPEEIARDEEIVRRFRNR